MSTAKFSPFYAVVAGIGRVYVYAYRGAGTYDVRADNDGSHYRVSGLPMPDRISPCDVHARAPACEFVAAGGGQ